MAKKMLIDATHAEETRVVVVEGNKVEEFDFESITKRPLAGNIYLAKVTRVEPSLQAAFVDYGGNRHGFLAFSEIHPDYYQIPIEDRQKLLDEEAAFARQDADEDEAESQQTEDEEASDDEDAQSETAQANSEGAGSSDDAVVSAPAADDGPLLVETPENGGSKPKRQSNRGGKRPRRRGGQSNRGRGGRSVKLSPEAEVAVMDAAIAEAEAYALAVAKGEITPRPARERGGRSRNRSRRNDQGRKSDRTENGDIENVGADDVQEEIRPRRQRMRRYNIQEVIKVRQVMLVQVVKEERGNKGAALTTYLSLAGRYCVLMPNTARGGGISRKITNPADRKKLKEIAGEIEVPEGAGLIVRTAGSQRTKTEIKRDYEYLLRQWEQIRDKTLSSIAPSLIYEEGDLIKRSIRDLYNKDIDEILVEGEAGGDEEGVAVPAGHGCPEIEAAGEILDVVVAGDGNARLEFLRPFQLAGGPDGGDRTRRKGSGKGGDQADGGEGILHGGGAKLGVRRRGPLRLVSGAAPPQGRSCYFGARAATASAQSRPSRAAETMPPA